MLTPLHRPRAQDAAVANQPFTDVGCGPGKVYDLDKSNEVCANDECTVGACCKDCETQNVAAFVTTTTGPTTPAVGATSLVVASAADIAVGMAVSSGDADGIIATNTRVALIVGTTLTLSKPTTAAVPSSGVTLTFKGDACASEHAGACVTTLAATATVDTAKLRCLVPHAGYFVDASGTAQPYFGTCGNTDGYGKVFGDAACPPGQIYDGTKFANSCEGTTCDDSTDAARCCKPATCGNTGDGSPFTDQECGVGYLYDTNDADTQCAGHADCQTTCCTDEQDTCNGDGQVRTRTSNET